MNLYVRSVDNDYRVREKCGHGNRNLKWINDNMSWLPLKKEDVINVARGNENKWWKADVAARFYEIRMAFDPDYRKSELDLAAKRYRDAVDKEIQSKERDVRDLQRKIIALGGSSGE
jgi:hypothetical protein